MGRGRRRQVLERCAARLLPDGAVLPLDPEGRAALEAAAAALRPDPPARAPLPPRARCRAHETGQIMVKMVRGSILIENDPGE